MFELFLFFVIGVLSQHYQNCYPQQTYHHSEENYHPQHHHHQPEVSYCTTVPVYDPYTPYIPPKCVTNVVIYGVLCDCLSSTTKIVNNDGTYACITGSYTCNATNPLGGSCCDIGFHLNMTTRTCIINPTIQCYGTCFNGTNANCTGLCVNGAQGLPGANGTCTSPCVNGTDGINGTNGTCTCNTTTYVVGVYNSSTVTISPSSTGILFIGSDYSETSQGTFDPSTGTINGGIDGGSFDFLIMINFLNVSVNFSVAISDQNSYGYGGIQNPLIGYNTIDIAFTTTNSSANLYVIIRNGDSINNVTFDRSSARIQRLN